MLSLSHSPSPSPLPITCNQPLRNIVTLVYNVLKTFMGMNGKMFDDLTNSYKSDRLRWVGVHPAVCGGGGGAPKDITNVEQLCVLSGVCFSTTSIVSVSYSKWRCASQICSQDVWSTCHLS